jgi:hypothetical protein
MVPAILRHEVGLVASPGVRYKLTVEGVGSLRFLLSNVDGSPREAGLKPTLGSTTEDIPCQAAEDAKKMAILLAGPSGEDPPEGRRRQTQR